MTKASERGCFSAPPVRQKPRRIGDQRGHQIERRVDQDRRRQRGADILRSQDQECVAGIAESEQGRRQQIFPVGPRKLPQADIDFGLCRHRRRSLLDEQDHEKGQQAGDERQIEDEANVDMQPISSRTASSGPRNAPALSPTPSSPKALPLFASSTEEAMSASRGAERVPAPSRSSKRPPNRPCQTVASAHQRLGDRRQGIARQRDGLSPLQLVRQGAGKALHDVLRGLGEAIHQADDAAACLQRLRQKNRQDRIEHLR